MLGNCVDQVVTCHPKSRNRIFYSFYLLPSGIDILTELSVYLLGDHIDVPRIKEMSAKAVDNEALKCRSIHFVKIAVKPCCLIIATIRGVATVIIRSVSTVHLASA